MWCARSTTSTNPHQPLRAIREIDLYSPLQCQGKTPGYVGGVYGCIDTRKTHTPPVEPKEATINPATNPTTHTAPTAPAATPAWEVFTLVPAGQEVRRADVAHQLAKRLGTFSAYQGTPSLAFTIGDKATLGSDWILSGCTPMGKRSPRRTQRDGRRLGEKRR